MRRLNEKVIVLIIAQPYTRLGIYPVRGSRSARAAKTLLALHHRLGQYEKDITAGPATAGIILVPSDEMRGKTVTLPVRSGHTFRSKSSSKLFPTTR